jgi:cytidylate kinase
MKKFIIILDGPMGSGKSTVGEILAKKLKRTALINGDKIKWFISDFKRCKKDNAIVQAVLEQMCKEYLKQGISLVIAQAFLNGIRPILPYVMMAKKNGAELLVYHLNAPKEVLLNRIDERKKNSKFSRTPIAKTRIYRNIRNWKKYRYSIGKELETDKIRAAKIASMILKEINSL